MPIFPYFCPDGHETEKLVARLKDAPGAINCSRCGKPAHRGVGVPNFSLSWNKKPIDTGKELWEGTPLEDGSELIDKYKFKKHGAKPQVHMERS